MYSLRLALEPVIADVVRGDVGNDGFQHIHQMAQPDILRVVVMVLGDGHIVNLTVGQRHFIFVGHGVPL